MAFYIKGIGNISPQQTWNGAALPDDVSEPHANRLRAIEPDYAEFVDAKNIRRMSRVIKMGVAAATIALRDADIKIPDAIITGTGYGCLEDTGIFLSKMIENKEVALNPTPFIQSTHNTIGSQIALILQCQGYNQTYAHGAFSFENALIDALIQSEEDKGKNILVGGVDEVTDHSHSIQSRFGLFRNNIANGEGAAFLLGNGESDKSFACIESVETFFKSDLSEMRSALKLHAAPDLLMLGTTNDSNPLAELCSDIFAESITTRFKHLCGEFPSASAFAVCAAAKILQMQQIPNALKTGGYIKKSIKRILIINASLGTHNSIIAMTHVE